MGLSAAYLADDELQSVIELVDLRFTMSVTPTTMTVLRYDSPRKKTLNSVTHSI